MPYLFFENFEYQDLWAKVCKLQQFRYFAMIFKWSD